MHLYRLIAPSIPGWGDYGDILVSGMAGRVARQNGFLQLERAGPFMPPISFPDAHNIVVTDSFRQALAGSCFSGITFLPVIKKHIVFLEWEKWDQTTADPEEYPESGEPEDYILQRPHSAEAALGLGEVWEACLGAHAEFVQYRGLRNWDGTDWFRARGQLEAYVSEAAKSYLEAAVPNG